MTKPTTAEGYGNEVTENCERVLVTLIRNLGPWRDSIFLVGGLTPRYLIEKRPPNIPAHAGTGDVDVVIQLHMLANTDAYHTLEDNFKKMGFTRGTNSKGKPVSWRWEIKAGAKTNVILERFQQFGEGALMASLAERMAVARRPLARIAPPAPAIISTSRAREGRESG